MDEFVEDGAPKLGKLRREGHEKRGWCQKEGSTLPSGRGDRGPVRWGRRAWYLRMSPLGDMDASTRPWESSRPKPGVLMGMRNGCGCFLMAHALFSTGNCYNSESSFCGPSTLIDFTFIWGDWQLWSSNPRHKLPLGIQADYMFSLNSCLEEPALPGESHQFTKPYSPCIRVIQKTEPQEV